MAWLWGAEFEWVQMTSQRSEDGKEEKVLGRALGKLVVSCEPKVKREVTDIFYGYGSELCSQRDQSCKWERVTSMEEKTRQVRQLFGSQL